MLVTDSSFIDSMPLSVAQQFWDRVAQSSDCEAFRFPIAGSSRWKTVSWGDLGSDVRRLAGALLLLGIEREDRVGILASTRYEWVVADLAIMCAGAATTTIYPSTEVGDAMYILEDSACRILFVEDAAQLAKISGHRDDLPALELIVVLEGEADEDGRTVTMPAMEDFGDSYLDYHPHAIDGIVSKIRPSDLATIIYTSGTTGRPKGVRLSHRAWVYEGALIAAQGILTEDDCQFLWLPMAHSFGKALLSAQLSCGFSTAIDGRPDRIVENLRIVQPTFMGAAPRIFEKAHAAAVIRLAAEGGYRHRLFDRAFKAGIRRGNLEDANLPVPWSLRMRLRVYDRLVFKQVREAFGGRVRYFVSGSAPLNREIAQWFRAAGILILEGYGLTENAAGATMNHPDSYRLGTVGLPVPGSFVRIGVGGEVQLNGPHLMDGYHNLPAETESAFTDDGWLRTGDMGHIDDDGYVRITGRIKELFKTSGGKYIAPAALEAKFKARCPYASQFLVVGSGRKYAAALICLDEVALGTWARAVGISTTSYSELVGTPEVHAMVGRYVDELNAEVNRWETIKRWAILDADMTIESGDLTPSLKVKREHVEAKHIDLIESLYS